MSGEDELRRRLQELPGPTGRLDVDAVVERAKQRRRPKVAAVSAVVTGAGVLIIAPFVVPGLSPLSTTTSVMSEQGAAQEQAPAAEQDSSGDSSGAAGAGESIAQACAYRPIVAETGIEAAFGDDPDDGIADIDLTLPAGSRVQVLGVAVAHVAADRDALAIVAAPDAGALLEMATGVGGATAGPSGSTAVLADVPLLDAPALGCGLDAPTAPAPLLLIEVDGARLAVIGDPFFVR